MATDHQMREHLKAVYPNSSSWPDRVKKTPSTQVLAVYRRFQAEGKIK